MPEYVTEGFFRTAAWAFGLAASIAFVSIANGTEQTNDGDKSLLITTNIPESPLTVDAVNSDDFAIVVKFHNTADREIIVSPFLSVELFDDKGNPVRPSTNLGRSGFRMTDSVLEGVSFVSIAAGKTHEIKVNLKRYVNDPLMIRGWQIPEAGEYQVKMRYSFDRELAKKTLGKGCRAIDAPEQPWNKALEHDRKFEVKLKVK